MPKRKYIENTLATKLQALKDIDEGLSQRAAATKYGVTTGTAALLLLQIYLSHAETKVY